VLEIDSFLLSWIPVVYGTSFLTFLPLSRLFFLSGWSQKQGGLSGGFDIFAEMVQILPCFKLEAKWFALLSANHFYMVEDYAVQIECSREWN
jgi:hypothetical protein